MVRSAAQRPVLSIIFRCLFATKETEFNMSADSTIMKQLMVAEEIVDLGDQDDLGYFVTAGTILHW